jgi:hypothetical protein
MRESWLSSNSLGLSPPSGYFGGAVPSAYQGYEDVWSDPRCHPVAHCELVDREREEWIPVIKHTPCNLLVEGSRVTKVRHVAERRLHAALHSMGSEHLTQRWR